MKTLPLKTGYVNIQDFSSIRLSVRATRGVLKPVYPAGHDQEAVSLLTFADWVHPMTTKSPAGMFVSLLWWRIPEARVFSELLAVSLCIFKF